MLQRTILATLLVVLAVLLTAVVVVVLRRARRAGALPGEVAEDEARAGLPLTRLPPDIPDLVGRDAECELLLGLGHATVVSVSGPPGVGKSALAVHAAHRLRPAFTDGVFHLDLQGSRPDRLSHIAALACLLHALDAGGPTGAAGEEAQAARWRSLLAGRRILLVLDDAADAEHVRPLLPDGTGCLALVTSREPLADPADAVQMPLRPLSEADAATLLASVLGRRRVARDPVAVATVTRTCDALPLALRVAGARIGVRPALPLVATADRLLHERLRLDAAGADHPGLTASVAFGYGHLSAEDARLFRRLALLPGRDFAAPVAAALTIAVTSEAERGLERLTAAGLLERAGRCRYRFHEVVRHFALGRLDAEETATSRRAARRRALSSYLVQSRAAGEVVGSMRPGTEDFHKHERTSGTEQVAALAWFERERLNLAAAVRLATDTVEPHIAWRLAASLAVFLDVRGYTQEWIDLGEVALRAARGSRDPYAVAVVLHDLGDAHRQQGHIATAAAFLTESLKGFGVLDSPQDEARVLVTLGRLHQKTRKLVTAVDDYRRSLAIFRAYGLRRDEIEVFTALGVVRRLQGRLEEAAVFLDEALDLVRATHSWRLVDDLTAARATENLGLVCLGQGKVAEAVAHHAQSLETFRAIGARRSQGYALRHLGESERVAGVQDEAARHYEESLALLTALGDRAGQGLVETSIGQLHTDLGRHEQAAQAYRRAVAAYEEAGDLAGEGRALLQLGKVLLHTEGVPVAAEPLRRAERILGELGAPEAKEARLLLVDLDWPDPPEDPDPLP